jgi:hypothetical protein
MFAGFERVTQRHPLCELAAATITLSASHASLEHYQGVFVLFGGVVDLIFCEYAKVLEDDDVVAAFEMPEEVGSAKYHP